ncbi:hypothetical protein Aoc01nite_66610 [Actinoplanes octamycinicus]|nr:hypothetical protein Aoc01nite_66610 [Actinoplanes octamycinicus]
MAAAVAGVAVVAIDRDGPVPAPAPGATGTSTTLSASQILLAAAASSAKDVPGAGRYLLFRTENGSVLTVRAGSATFRMTARSSADSWLSRSGQEPSRMFFQELGLTPLTPADDAAWRAAGSPAQVMVGKPLPTGQLGHETAVDVAGQGRQSTTWDDRSVYAFGNTNVSVRDLEKLPTDPAALRTALLKYFDGGGGDMPSDRDQWLLAVASSLFTGIPVSGPVRAAAFRLIATLPGVRSLGVVADQRGRQGQGFAFTQGAAATGTIERRFVIDLRTGRALGDETRVLRPAGTTARLAPGSLLAYTVVLEQRITSDTPE